MPRIITSILYTPSSFPSNHVHLKHHFCIVDLKQAQSSRGPLREINTTGARKCLPLPSFFFFPSLFSSLPLSLLPSISSSSPVSLSAPFLDFSTIFNHFASSVTPLHILAFLLVYIVKLNTRRGSHYPWLDLSMKIAINEKGDKGSIVCPLLQVTTIRWINLRN